MREGENGKKRKERKEDAREDGVGHARSVRGGSGRVVVEVLQEANVGALGVLEGVGEEDNIGLLDQGGAVDAL